MFGYSSSHAQKKVAVDWEKPADSEAFNRELDFFGNHNVSYLFVSHPLSKDEIALLDSVGISFFVKLNHKFVTENEFIINSDQYLKSVNDAKAHYGSSSTFNGIIAFSQSIIPSDVLPNTGILEVKGNTVYSVNAHSQPLFSIFETSDSYAENLSRFKELLINSELILLLDGNWYKSLLDQIEDLKSIFEGRTGMDPSAIAVPDIPDQTPLIHWSIVVLIGLWISLAVNVATNPTYLETIPRYFTAHRFYVDDIMSYRERTSASAIFLLFQHAIFGGLVSYILAKMFISDTGLEALYHHIPYIAVMGKNYFSLFVLTSVLVLIVELIALVWLYAPNKEMTHLNQGLNLFTSIFHLDFIIVTTIVTGYFGDWNTTLIVLLSLSYLLIWFSSFNITAFDASKRLGMHRNSYLFKTIGLHTLVSGALVVLLIVFNEWWDILELAVSV